MELCEPYDTLREFLPLNKVKEIFRLFRGKRVYFPRDTEYAAIKYPELQSILTREELDLLCFRLEGEIYFPTKSYSVKNVHELIRRDFDGYNTAALAIKYQYSERQIFNIVGRKLNKKYKPSEGQLSFFDD